MNKLKIVSAVTLAVLISSGAMASNTSGSAAPSGPQPHWSYSGSDGPGGWGDLSPAYSLCSNGNQQSPVNLTAPQQAGLANVETHYKPVSLDILNNGHTIQVNYTAGSKMTIGHAEYDLLQFHFHTPSENTVDGKTYPMEAHFVHKSKDGTLGVLGVFFEEGNSNSALQEIWAHMPKKAEQHDKVDNVIINGRDLLPENQDYYRFVGSLTTPPCSEGVQWHVLKTPIPASSSQIKAFHDVIGNNARPVQKLGKRLLIDSEHGAATGGASGSSTH